jgi:hypothetical protein
MEVEGALTGRGGDTVVEDSKQKTMEVKARPNRDIARAPSTRPYRVGGRPKQGHLGRE